MRNKKEWFSANELAGVTGLPSSPQGVNKRARTQDWKKRNKAGVQGGAVEYHYSSLPEETQRVLGFSSHLKIVSDNTPANLINAGIDVKTLTDSIETLEEALEITNRTMLPRKKAELIIAIYDLLIAKKQGKEVVLNLIKSIA